MVERENTPSQRVLNACQVQASICELLRTKEAEAKLVAYLASLLTTAELVEMNGNHARRFLCRQSLLLPRQS